MAQKTKAKRTEERNLVMVEPFRRGFAKKNSNSNIPQTWLKSIAARLFFGKKRARAGDSGQSGSRRPRLAATGVGKSCEKTQKKDALLPGRPAKRKQRIRL
jgi:hypothetical protein